MQPKQQRGDLRNASSRNEILRSMEFAGQVFKCDPENEGASLERFARAFAEAGFVEVVHDHRNFGASDGAERRDVHPWQQIADSRRAISFLEPVNRT